MKVLDKKTTAAERCTEVEAKIAEVNREILRLKAIESKTDYEPAAIKTAEAEREILIRGRFELEADLNKAQMIELEQQYRAEMSYDDITQERERLSAQIEAIDAELHRRRAAASTLQMRLNEKRNVIDALADPRAERNAPVASEHLNALRTRLLGI